MDYLSGGDLRYHIGRNRKFSEKQTQFFIGCVILSLEYLHQQNIIHRDIKPENLILDHKGYLHLTDLGIARKSRQDNAQDTSGTPGYMAPEVMCRQNHNFSVDFFAVGVIAYECMLGKRPYVGRSRQEIRDKILAKQVQIKKGEIPDNWSCDSVDFINKLIMRKPFNRLGNNGIGEIKSHPWMIKFPFSQLLRKEIKAPYIPNPIADNFDIKQLQTTELDEDQQQQSVYLLRRNSIQKLFSGYSYQEKRINQSNFSIISTSDMSNSNTKNFRNCQNKN